MMPMILHDDCQKGSQEPWYGSQCTILGTEYN